MLCIRLGSRQYGCCYWLAVWSEYYQMSSRAVRVDLALYVICRRLWCKSFVLLVAVVGRAEALRGSVAVAALHSSELTCPRL